MLVQFVGGTVGDFQVVESKAVVGEALPAVTRVAVCEGRGVALPDGAWTLRGVTSHQRYVEHHEGAQLRAVQAGLGRPEARCAAMIPITKFAAWWDLAQDERREIFEDKSRHIAATMRFLPAIARRLHHGRDLGEPFDFVTWFEFAPEHSGLFDELLGLLRATEEWRYVEREVELRLTRV
jgi:chlorite dismutase